MMKLDSTKETIIRVSKRHNGKSSCLLISFLVVYNDYILNLRCNLEGLLFLDFIHFIICISEEQSTEIICFKKFPAGRF